GDGYLTASEIGLYLSSELTNYTEEAQTPRYGKLRDPDYDRGDFVFALPARLTAPSPAAPAAGAAETGEGADGPAKDPAQMMEITFWASVAASEDPTVIATYLEKYPDGNFAGLARARIAALEKQAAATAPSSDTAAPADTAADTGDAPVVTDGQAGQAGPDATADEPALTLESGVNLAAVDGKDDLSWLPSVGGTVAESFQLTEQRLLPEGFFGVGEAAATLSKATAAVASDVGDRGYAIAGSAWNFSDPQADSQYRVDKEWIHLRAPGNHDLWDCRRHLAPILSVPVPDTDSWTAQVWFQLPARIGRSHTGLVVWNGVDKDGPTHALYFGPAETDGLSVGGSYRSDCSGGSGDIAGRPDSRGTFNLHYTGGRGWLRITKSGDRLNFYFKSPFMNEWREVGSMLTEIKDGLVNVGLMAKTWGNEPVIASYADFRIIPGVATAEAWQPAYYARLEADGAATFAGSDFADFEWDDPNGDSIHEIAGAAVTMKTGGNHDIWDCRRKSAPILSVKAPPLDRWSAEVDFDMPARVGRSHLGLIAWNGRSEEAPVHALYFGPAETNGLSVGGSNAVDCSSGSGDLSRQFRSEGSFSIGYDRGKGRLRIARDGDRISFYFKSPAKRNWQHVGTTLASVRDDFSRIGLMMKTWGGEPVTVTFSNFRILAGETEPGRSIPNYYAGLKTGQPVTFAGEDFADFEWSDPDGNSVNEIRGKRVRLYTGGGHGGIWDCHRNKAPILSVEAPPRDAWVTQVRFKLPARADRTSANLVLWNGAESGEAKWLAFGPGGIKGLNVSGSYSDDCSASSGEIAKHSGNTGNFGIDDHVGGEGTLQIVKFGWSYRFSLFDPQSGEWTTLGTVQSTVKDGFSRIGLTVTSWGGNTIEAEFSDFTIIPGLFN
ncbi:MAG: hypothetical protein KDJ16_11510, partial [Hyphomicrobiales bacterium]|nr:hypothetical protein [Hyphomicrobiales bacterium]